MLHLVLSSNLRFITKECPRVLGFLLQTSISRWCVRFLDRSEQGEVPGHKKSRVCASMVEPVASSISWSESRYSTSTHGFGKCPLPRPSNVLCLWSWWLSLCLHCWKAETSSRQLFAGDAFSRTVVSNPCHCDEDQGRLLLSPAAVIATPSYQPSPPTPHLPLPLSPPPAPPPQLKAGVAIDRATAVITAILGVWSF